MPTNSSDSQNVAPVAINGGRRGVRCEIDCGDGTEVQADEDGESGCGGRSWVWLGERAVGVKLCG